MSAIEFWTLTANLSAVVVDYVDLGPDPDIQKISATLDIIPRIPTGALVWAPGMTPPQGIALARIKCRFDTDGVLRTIAASPVDAQQTVTVTGSPTGGTFTLTFKGQTTSSIPRNATTAQMDTALEALPTIGAGNITVGGPTGGPWVVSFAGAMGRADQPDMTATPSLTGGTSPGVNVATTRLGTQAGGVQLVANTNAIDLDELFFDLVFSNVVFNKSDQFIASFAILAPTEGGGTFDLSEMDKYLPKPGLP